MSDPDVSIATIEKNAGETLHVAIREYRGHRFVDFRLYYRNGVEMKPSGKGFGLKADKLCDLREAIELAEAEARRLGLLSTT